MCYMVDDMQSADMTQGRNAFGHKRFEQGTQPNQSRIFCNMSKEALQAIDETRNDRLFSTESDAIKESSETAEPRNIGGGTCPQSSRENFLQNFNSFFNHNLKSSQFFLKEVEKTLPAISYGKRNLCASTDTETKYEQYKNKDFFNEHEMVHEIEIDNRFVQPILRTPNVFERLTATYTTSQKVTARQRTKERLSLNLMNSNCRKHTKLYKLSEPSKADSRCRTAKSSSSTKMLESSHQYAGPSPRTDAELLRSKTSLDIIRTDDYVAPMSIPEIETRAFETTPKGYDSRYISCQYNDASNRYSDDEESCEVIKQAKIKCRKWLTKQLSLIGPT